MSLVLLEPLWNTICHKKRKKKETQASESEGPSLKLQNHRFLAISIMHSLKLQLHHNMSRAVILSLPPVKGSSLPAGQQVVHL